MHLPPIIKKIPLICVCLAFPLPILLWFAMSCIHVGSVDAHVDHTLNIAHFDVCDNIEKTPDVELVFDPPAVAGASVTTWHQRPEGGFRVSVRFTGDQNPKSVVLRRVGYHYFWFGTAAVFSNS